MGEISYWLDRLLDLVNRILMPVPEPFNFLARIILIVIVISGILTFLMKTWQKIKPKPRIEDINTVRGKHSRSVKRDAVFSEKAGNYVAAADAWRALGKTQRALSLYQKAGAMDRAGELLINEGKSSEAITLWEGTGNYNLAAKQLASEGNFERAAANFAKANNHPQTAEMFEKAGVYDQAGDFYTKAGFHAKAASNYVKAGKTLPAAQAYSKYFLEQAVNLGGNINPQRAQSIKEIAKQSGILFQKAGQLDEAAEIFMRGGFNVEAGRILEQLGHKERAAKLYEEAGRDDLTASLYVGTDDARGKAAKAKSLKSQGKTVEAAKAFSEAEDYIEAAELFAQAGMNLDAANMFVKVGNYMDAAAMFLQAGDLAQAANAYEGGRDFESAIKLREKLGDEDGVIRAIIKAGRPLEAAQRLFKLRRTNEAYQACQGIGPKEEGYREACLMMAKIQASANRIDIAIQLVQRGIQGEPLGPATMELYYALGRLFEQRRDFALAVEIYSRILAENLGFKDVAMRRQGLTDQLARTAPPPPTPVTGDKTTVFDEQGPAKANPRYKIIEELGRGGMGVVYKAMDTVLDRTIAYKVLPPDMKNHPKVVASFGKEAKALAALQHPNIVMVFDAGGIGGEYFFAMEYIEGQNLKDIIRNSGVLPMAEVVRISSALAEALNYAHGKKIMHRDIKTSNVMINSEGQVKLMDFGLAKVLGEAAHDRTAVSGTPYYMSPEQIHGEGVDHRTDIYSLGVMMYELASGTVPFRDGDIQYHHLHTMAKPPRSIRPEIPEALEKIILKCVEKEKEKRYQSAGQIVEDLKNVPAA